MMSTEMPTEFTPANELEKMFVAAATDPTQRPRFYRELLDGDIFYLAIYDEIGIRIQTVKQLEQEVVPIFTSRALLEHFARGIGLKEFRHEQSGARELFMNVEGAIVVLNPGAPYGKNFSPEEVRGMLDGSAIKWLKLIRLDEEAPMLLSQPAIYPQEMLNDLAASFAFHNSVQIAYLAQVHQPSKRQLPQLVIAIETVGTYEPDEAEDIIFEGLGDDEFVTFIKLDEDIISNYMRANSEPFFKRDVTAK